MNKSMRYAHSEGHTDLCFDETGSHLLTCGNDGDVRVWQGIDDDDPVSHRVGELVNSIAFKNERFYTASDDSSVRVHLFKDGQPDGLLLRFTAPVTHICFNASGSKCIAGSGDFQIKVLETETSTQKLLQGHDAPILSLSLHPAEKLLASSSCDGTVRVWDLQEYTQIKTFSVVPKSNDFTLSKTLCRLTWSKDGKYLFIPVGEKVQAYSSDTWEQEFTLKQNNTTQQVSIVTTSPCGKYLAGSTVDGWILIWDLHSRACINSTQHDKKLTISALAWHPKSEEQQLAFCDNHGNLCVCENVLPDSQTSQQSGEGVGESVDTFADLFDDVEDDMMLQASASAMEGGGEGMAADNLDVDAGSDDDDIPSLRKRTNPMILDEDSNSKDGALPPDNEDSSGMPPPAPVQPLAHRGPPPTPLQEPFQPGSCPTHLSHRFMVWNSVGIVRQYNTEEENSIDVEFHDIATHHAIHVANILGHSMAALSGEAVLLACEGDDDTPSKLVCMHFASRDSSKEWTVSMPDGEDILAVALGEGWLAVATDARLLRVFSISGIQRDVISLPGPVVTLAAHMTQLMVVYHKGPGLPGDQNLGVQLLHVCGRRRTVIRGDCLPIAHKATLVWLGFSAEGTPSAVDSQGLVYMLNRKMGNTWVPAANLRSHCSGSSDHQFLVGIHENPPQIRCIACKGNRYPATLPRPNVSILPFQLPLCEMSTEKGQLEESYLRHQLLSTHLDYWAAEGYEVDDAARSEVMLPQQEILMKLFALACKSERETRAAEICEMMPGQHLVQLAIKYATRLRLLPLAQTLSEIAHNKAEQEAAEEAESIQEDEQELPSIPAHRSSWGQRNGHSEGSSRVAGSDEEMEVAGGDEDVAGDDEEDGDIYEQLERDDGEEGDENKHRGPMLTIKEDKKPKSLSTSQTGPRKNPFKVGSGSVFSPGMRGSSVFDSMQQKTAARNQANASTDILKPKKKIFLGKKKSEKQEKNDKEKVAAKKPGKSAFQLWFDAKHVDLEEEHPDLDPTDLTVVAAKTFKELSEEDKKEWQETAKQQSSNADEERKRKRETSGPLDKLGVTKDGQLAEPKKKKPLGQSTNSKLAAFMFNKDS